MSIAVGVGGWEPIKKRLSTELIAVRDLEHLHQREMSPGP